MLDSRRKCSYLSFDGRLVNYGKSAQRDAGTLNSRAANREALARGKVLSARQNFTQHRVRRLARRARLYTFRSTQINLWRNSSVFSPDSPFTRARIRSRQSDRAIRACTCAAHNVVIPFNGAVIKSGDSLLTPALLVLSYSWHTFTVVTSNPIYYSYDCLSVPYVCRCGSRGCGWLLVCSPITSLVNRRHRDLRHHTITFNSKSSSNYSLPTPLW